MKLGLLATQLTTVAIIAPLRLGEISLDSR